MEILGAVASAPVPMSLSKLTEETGIPKPTVRRIANQLVAHGVLYHHLGGYRIGLRVTELGGMAARQLGSAELAASFVHELHRRTGQIAWIGAVSDDCLVMLDTAFARDHVRIMGTSWPPKMKLETIAATAAGQLMMALRANETGEVPRWSLTRLTPYTVTSPQRHLDRLRSAAETGEAVEWEEVRLGWWCGAALVPGPTTTHIVGLTSNVHELSAGRGLGQLRRIADGLSRELSKGSFSR
ncbi:IclR family transcriptional regulator [Streptomyces olivoreticuli]|uniref:IclR family transcriptional regulator n=1 Tax=Streptomyces olivoreticuli TaxID=68246 RepID=UPI0013C36FDC|nr:helix-turn-helix domain-containing protein [Streptomyces olivoreticuli]